MAAQQLPPVNILPTDRFEYSKIGRFLSWALTTGRYIVVVVELVVIIAFLSRFWFDRTISDLREVRVQREAVVDSYNDTLEAFLRRQSQLASIRNILNQQFGVAVRLAQLQGFTPSGIEYQEVSVSSESASVRGFASTAATFSILLTNLQGDNTYEEINVKSLGLSIQRSPGFDFELELRKQASATDSAEER